MKHKGVILIIVILIGAAFIMVSLRDRTPQTHTAFVGLRAPDFELLDESGNTVSSSQLAGKTVFMHFWASWCKECREEMPGIQALYDRNRSDPSFVFLGVIYRENLKTSKRWLKENKYDFPVFVDPGYRGARVFGVTGVPETYIIGPDRILKQRIIGPARWTEE